MNEYFRTAPATGAPQVNYDLKLNDTQTQQVLDMQKSGQNWNNWMNAANGALGFGMDLSKSIMSYNMMHAMIGLQQSQIDANKEIQLGVLSLNGSMLEKQETIALAQLRTSERLGELTKERDVEVAKAKSSAAVQIAKVNSLNSQFYGKPAQSSNWGV